MYLRASGERFIFKVLSLFTLSLKFVSQNHSKSFAEDALVLFLHTGYHKRALRGHQVVGSSWQYPCFFTVQWSITPAAPLPAPSQTGPKGRKQLFFCSPFSARSGHTQHPLPGPTFGGMLLVGTHRPGMCRILSTYFEVPKSQDVFWPGLFNPLGFPQISQEPKHLIPNSWRLLGTTDEKPALLKPSLYHSAQDTGPALLPKEPPTCPGARKHKTDFLYKVKHIRRVACIELSTETYSELTLKKFRCRIKRLL